MVHTFCYLYFLIFEWPPKFTVILIVYENHKQILLQSALRSANWSVELWPSSLHLELAWAVSLSLSPLSVYKFVYDVIFCFFSNFFIKKTLFLRLG